MLIFYTVYYLASFLIVCYLYCKKAAKFESDAQKKMKEIQGEEK